MSTDGWTEAVRHQLGLGRLLPMGEAPDGAWLTEAAARTVLRRSADEVPGVR
ncbi:nucleopolyhedrovirus P10 family protein, partial [Streptomyces fulvissimus]|nr:nucleopolyhedrovirus P10 family protein [Streptomyces microflavus]